MTKVRYTGKGGSISTRMPNGERLHLVAGGAPVEVDNEFALWLASDSQFVEVVAPKPKPAPEPEEAETEEEAAEDETEEEAVEEAAPKPKDEPNKGAISVADLSPGGRRGSKSKA